MNILKYATVISLFTTLLATIVSGIIFFKSIKFFQTDQDWRFYFSLMGFIIFGLIFISVIIMIIAKRKSFLKK